MHDVPWQGKKRTAGVDEPQLGLRSIKLPQNQHAVADPVCYSMLDQNSQATGYSEPHMIFVINRNATVMENNLKHETGMNCAHCPLPWSNELHRSSNSDRILERTKR